MSRKTQRNQVTPQEQPQPATRTRRTGIVVATLVALVLAAVAATVLYRRAAPPADVAAATTQAALASTHSPTLGDASARVHVVEFLDPACETCAQFFPLVKQRMAENPDRIRLSVRHLAFHDGSDYVVRILEASRKQASTGRPWRRCWPRRPNGRRITPLDRSW